MVEGFAEVLGEEVGREGWGDVKALADAGEGVGGGPEGFQMAGVGDQDGIVGEAAELVVDAVDKRVAQPVKTSAASRGYVQ